MLLGFPYPFRSAWIKAAGPIRPLLLYAVAVGGLLFGIGCEASIVGTCSTDSECGVGAICQEVVTPDEVVKECIVGCRESSPDCPEAEECVGVSGLEWGKCRPTSCTDSSCPPETTCWPPPSPSQYSVCREWIPCAQDEISCSPGQCADGNVCRSIVVALQGGGEEFRCGCVP